MGIFSERLKRMSGRRRPDYTRHSYSMQEPVEERKVFKAEPDTGLADTVTALKESAAANGEVLKGIDAKLDGLTQLNELSGLKENLEDCSKEVREAIHTENVKVYRNVQAVVVDETAKVKETVETSGKSVEAKVNAAISFAVLAFLIAVVHFAFDILCNLGIF